MSYELPELMNAAGARKRLRFCDSYSRMETLVELADDMWEDQWHLVLGEEWSCCDNIGLYFDNLRQLLPKRGPVLPMMDDAERAAYAALPEVVTVYRGCGRNNMRGASWSLEREVAARFPFLNRYYAETPILVTATVRKHQILALKLDRDEAEVITFAARRASVEPIEEVPA